MIPTDPGTLPAPGPEDAERAASTIVRILGAVGADVKWIAGAPMATRTPPQLASPSGHMPAAEPAPARSLNSFAKAPPSRRKPDDDALVPCEAGGVGFDSIRKTTKNKSPRTTTSLWARAGCLCGG